jgi:branched-subunit amino acid aminotransferase/4-amino-4-deoxychorismate lyase
MILHMDDHMVHRGHGVHESVHLTDGYLYQLPQHIARLKKSAADAGITMPMTDAQIMRVILDTAAASKKSNGKACMPQMASLFRASLTSSLLQEC